MKIYPDKTECPPVTEAQKAELIKRVREGTMNWINSLMTRAGVTPEECATPEAKFPPDIMFNLLEKGYDVNTTAMHPKLTPAEKHKIYFYNFAVAHGINRSDVLEYFKYDKEFAEKLEEINELAMDGERHIVEISVDDLKPLIEEE